MIDATMRMAILAIQEYQLRRCAKWRFLIHCKVLAQEIKGAVEPPPATRIERRAKPRVVCNYPAVVRGRTPEGVLFEEPAMIVNLSATGLYLRLNRRLSPGNRLFVCFRFGNASAEGSQALGARAVVVRRETGANGASGLGLRLERYRFL